MKHVLEFGPGPSLVSPEVAQAGLHTFGHMDSEFIQIALKANHVLGRLFGTESEFVYAGTGNGTIGAETALFSSVIPDAKVIVLNNSLFSKRMLQSLKWNGRTAVPVDFPPGAPPDLDQVDYTLAAHPDAQAIYFVLAATDTGVQADGFEIARIARQRSPEIKVIVDAVTAIGGIPIDADNCGYDAVHAGSQKCLSVPPGVFPIMFSKSHFKWIAEERGDDGIPWSTDPRQVMSYIGNMAARRLYHTTAATTLYTQLGTAAGIIALEGLEKVYFRHQLCGKALQDGIEALGLTIPVAQKHRLPMLTPVRLPEGIKPAEILAEARAQHNLAFGAALGEWAENTIRIGLMGYGAQPENVRRIIAVLYQILSRRGLGSTEAFTAVEKRLTAPAE